MDIFFREFFKFRRAVFKENDHIDRLDISICKILFKSAADTLILPEQEVCTITGTPLSREFIHITLSKPPLTGKQIPVRGGSFYHISSEKIPDALHSLDDLFIWLHYASVIVSTVFPVIP
jgi:hypothetical protein